MKHLKRNTDKQDFEKQVGWNLGKSHRVGMKEEIYIRIQIYIFSVLWPNVDCNSQSVAESGPEKECLRASRWMPREKNIKHICVYISMLEVPPRPRMQSWSPGWHDMLNVGNLPQKKLHLPGASIVGGVASTQVTKSPFPLWESNFEVRFL